jgi:hypothetical protein
VTFTLPSELRALARSQQKRLYGLLLQAAAASLQTLCAHPRWMGGQPCLTGALPTWTRALLYHPHAHFLVSAGGLSADGQRWQPARHLRFLVPVRALSVLFRAKIRDGLQAAGLLDRAPAKAWRQPWVVPAQPAGRGDKVLDYLGRYVFRIALTQSRLEALENGQVTFRYRDNRTQQVKHLRLPAAQFVQRFLQHVLPKSLAKVPPLRSGRFGLSKTPRRRPDPAPNQRQALARCRAAATHSHPAALWSARRKALSALPHRPIRLPGLASLCQKDPAMTFAPFPEILPCPNSPSTTQSCHSLALPPFLRFCLAPTPLRSHFAQPARRLVLNGQPLPPRPPHRAGPT